MRGVLLLVISLLPVPVLGEPHYVDIVNGPPSAFEVLRNGQRLKVAPFTLLQVGDRISVLRARNNLFEDSVNYIELALGDSKKRKVTFEVTKDKPYEVRQDRHYFPQDSWIGRFMDSVRVWFARLQKHEIRLVSRRVREREEAVYPLSIPLLEGNKTWLVGGKKRAVHLAWSGGEPPFGVRVYPADSRIALLEKLNVRRRSVIMQKKVIREGHYQVVVKDAQDRKVEAMFTAVVESRPILLSPDAEAILRSALPDPTKRTLLAAWLAAQGEGEWALEAYQHVAQLTMHYHPALLVSYGLEAGSRPIIEK